MIRPATRADVGALHRLWRALWDEQAPEGGPFRLSPDADERWRNDVTFWLRDEAALLLVLELDGAVCGFVRAELWRPPPIYAPALEAYVDEVYVMPQYRGAEWGRRLVEQVERWATGRGATALRAGVVAGNGAGGAFWARVGAAPVHAIYRKPLASPSDKAAGPPRRAVGF